jgi:hypothetical protein
MAVLNIVEAPPLPATIEELFKGRHPADVDAGLASWGKS